jgi:hypothetical protein
MVTHPLAALSLGRALIHEDSRRFRAWSRHPRTKTVAESRVYLVEHYDAHVNEGTAAVLAGRLARATRGRSRGVRLIGSACVPSESFLSLFASSSREAVASVVERAGVVADRIVPVLWLGVEDGAGPR